jgi:hypothetical protein
MARINEETGLKKCSKCHEFKTAEMFSKQKSTVDNLKSQCKECIAKGNKALNYKPADNLESIICNTCNKEKNVDSFCFNSKNKTGYNNKCKDCTKDYDKSRNNKPNFDLITKECRVCKTEWYIYHFHLNKASSDGFNGICIFCQKEYINSIDYSKDMSIVERECASCNVIQPIFNFNASGKHSSGYRAICKNCEASYHKIHNKNPVVKAMVARNSKRNRNKDELSMLKARYRGLMSSAFKTTNNFKDCHSGDVLGCSILEFKNFIFNQNPSFILNKDNHLDHVIPISLAKTKDDVLALSHYSNFRPTTSVENIIKHNKVLPDLIESHFKENQDSPAYKFYLEYINNGDANDYTSRKNKRDD